MNNKLKLRKVNRNKRGEAEDVIFFGILVIIMIIGAGVWGVSLGRDATRAQAIAAAIPA